MKRIRLLAFFTCLFLLLSLTSCGEKTATDFSFGRVKDGIYTNDMLSLGFRFPDGWEVAVGTRISELLGRSDRKVATDMSDEDLAALEAAPDFTCAYAFVSSSNDSRNRDRMDLIFIKNETEGKTAQDFINETRANLVQYDTQTGGDWNFRVVSNEKVTISGHEYIMMETSMEGTDEENGLVNLRFFYLVTEAEGYFVNLVTTTEDPDFAFTDLIQSLQSASGQLYKAEE